MWKVHGMVAAGSCRAQLEACCPEGSSHRSWRGGTLLADLDPFDGSNVKYFARRRRTQEDHPVGSVKTSACGSRGSIGRLSRWRDSLAALSEGRCHPKAAPSLTAPGRVNKQSPSSALAKSSARSRLHPPSSHSSLSLPSPDRVA